MLIIAAFFVSCKVNSGQYQDGDSITVTANKLRIIFLTYNIQIDENGGDEKVELVQKIVTEGSIKKRSPAEENGKIGDLLCVQLGNNKEKINQILIENPLIKTVEYADQQGNLTKKEIKLDHVQFSLRVQLAQDTKYIVIEKIMATDQQNHQLANNKLE